MPLGLDGGEFEGQGWVGYATVFIATAGQLSQIRVQLTREMQADRDTRHDDRDEMIQVTVCRCGELQGPEADIVKGFVIDAESFSTS